MRRYQGEDINFNIVFEKGSDCFEIDGWSGFKEITALMYTDGCTHALFSSLPKEGYEILTAIDDVTLFGRLPNRISKILSPGKVRIELKAIMPDNSVCIKKESTGLYLAKNLIKNN